MLIEVKVVLEYLLWESWLKILAAASAKLVRYLSVGLCRALAAVRQQNRTNQPTNHRHFIIHIMSPSILTYTTTLA